MRKNQISLYKIKTMIFKWQSERHKNYNYYKFNDKNHYAFVVTSL